ncbi:ATP-dependent DNA helicase PIF1-like protein [Tanacetum coccineum]
MMFNCHINVKACSSIVSVKYIFKYVYKGHDKQVVHIDPDVEGVVINEIKRFQDVRYASPLKEMWRIFGFPLTNMQPKVLALQIHFPNQQMVSFRDDELMTNIVDKERYKRSMLTAFFEMNKTDRDVRRLWDDHYDLLSEDFTRQYQNAHLGRSMVLKDINIYTQSMGKSVDDFDLPKLNSDLSMQFRGKMYLYKALLAEVPSHGLLAVTTASSGAAANNMSGGRTAHSRGSSDDIISRVILSTKNKNVDDINEKLIDRFPGAEKIYYSYDKAEDDINNYYLLEFLNSLTVSGLPPHVLCTNMIDAEMSVGQHVGKRVFVSRIPLCLSESDMFSFKMKRNQFPVRLSFDMTIKGARTYDSKCWRLSARFSILTWSALCIIVERDLMRQHKGVSKACQEVQSRRKLPLMGSLQMDDDDDEISNLIDLHMYVLCGGWKWQELLLWWM